MYIRDVFLVEHGESSLPQNRSIFYESGRVANGVTFSTAMSEEEVASVMLEAFPQLGSIPSPRYTSSRIY